MSDSLYCEIRIKSHLAQRWCDWLGGLDIENQPDGGALLSGVLPDQAALYGVICQMRDLGLTLASICCVESQPCESAGQGRGDDTGP